MKANLLRALLSAPPVVSSEKALEFANSHYGTFTKIHSLGGERDRNFLLENGDQRILLKISNIAETQQTIEMQCAALDHLFSQSPNLPVQWLIKANNNAFWTLMEAENNIRLIVRAFKYLPGVNLEKVALDLRLMRNAGNILAHINRGLRGFSHSDANQPLVWNLLHLEHLQDLLEYVTDQQLKGLLKNVLNRFSHSVKPSLHGLRSQVIHNDFAFHNVLTDPEAPFTITGVYDFGDLTYGPLAIDLAVAAAEIPAKSHDSLGHAAELIAGFHQVIQLEDIEFELLPDLMSCRLAQGLLLGFWAKQEVTWSDDREHLIGWDESAINFLQTLEGSNKNDLIAQIRNCCELPPQHSAGVDQKSTKAICPH